MKSRLHLLPVFLFLALPLAKGTSPCPTLPGAICDFTITGDVTPCTAIPPNGAVDITVTPPDNYTYAWSNGATTEDITDLPGGTYTVTVTLPGICTSTAEFVVIAYTPGPLTVSGEVTPDTCGVGVGAINLRVWAGVPPFVFSWSNGATTEDLTGITGPSAFFVTVTDANGGQQVLDFFVNNTTNFFNNDINNYYSLSISHNTTCTSPPDGSIVFTPLTAIPFIWSWSNGVNTPSNPNLSGGNYAATVTLGNCSQSWNPNLAVFDTPLTPGVAIAPVDPICGASNGMLNLSVTAGVPAYSFQWSNADGSFSATTEDVSNLPANDYSVTVTGGNACTTTASITLSNINLNININGTAQANTSCTNANGSVTTTVAPNPPPAGFSYGYNWSNGQQTPGITGLSAGNYSVTVSLGSTCSATTSFVVANGTQAPSLSVSTTAADCLGPGSVDLSLSGGNGPFVYLWSNGATTQDLPSVAAGSYSATVTAADGCTATTMALVANNNASIDTTFITDTTCDSMNVGTTAQTLTGASGCDSVVVTTLSLAASDTTLIFENTCDISQAGVFEEILTNQAGCDSTIITTIAYVGSDTTQLSGTTCDIAQTGVFTENLTNQFGCDSVVITTLVFAAADTTLLFENTCDNLQAGVFEQLLTNGNGCDSLVITTINYSGSDTTALFEISCDPSQAGVLVQNLTNQFGCDSVIVTTISYAAADTTLLFDTSCALSDIGIFQMDLTNSHGCDSVVITTITYAAADTTAIYGTTCDSQAAGVFEQTLVNSNGCDSLVITTISLLASDTTELFSTSCQPASVGVFVQHFLNTAGCDSTVVSTVTYSLSDTTWVNSATCDAAQTGIFTQNLTTAEGCDSVVITTVGLLPTSITSLSATTCNPAEAGIFTETLTNWLGCDSVVTTTVTLLPSSNTNLTATTCDPSQVGVFTDIFPTWLGCDSTVTTTVTLIPSNSTSLNATTCDPAQAGVFTETLTNWLGCDSVVTTTVTLLPPLTLALDSSDYSGFGVSCAGGSDGWIQASFVAGTLPLTFNWSNGSSSPFNSGLAAGSYTATVTDGNGCTSNIGPIMLTAPPALMLILYANDVNCSGLTSGSISVSAEGGIPPYLYKIADDWVSFGYFDGLAAGLYPVTAEDANGCVSQTTATVEDISTLTADLGDDITVEAGDSVTLTVVTNVPIGTITDAQWFGIGNVSCTDCLSQTFFPQETRDYQVRIEDINGCVAFDEIRVEVLPGEDKHSIYVPTAFSPNKDGINDELVLYGGNYVKKINSFVILDNWGDVVFEFYNFPPNNNGFGWDGRQRGRLMDPAGFVWFAEVEFTDGVVKRFKGTTILVR